jgi:hypothetical protein
VTIDGTTYVAKHLRAGGDWLMRSSGDFGLRELALWEHGVFAAMPDEIDHAVVDVARDGDRGVLLMRDATDALFPDCDEPITLEQHDALVDRIASLHAAWWEWPDQLGLVTTAHRYVLFRPSLAELEARHASESPLPALIGQGWKQFESRARSSTVVFALLDDPTPLVRGLQESPATLLHGDVKIANLGLHPDGRMIMIDWAFAGCGPPGADLAWYLSLNRARVPEPKEAVVDRYRRALERRGIDTGPWWDRQLALALLGGLVQMGWEKALGDADELAWWDAEATAAITRYLS